MGAVFCNDAKQHDRHPHPDRAGDCPGRGLQEVCASCGRRADQVAGADCDTWDWHDTTPPALPEPALAGPDLVRHLQRDRDALQDQVLYATRLLTVMAQRAGGRLTVTMQELDAVEGLELQVWRNDAADALEYRVREP